MLLDFVYCFGYFGSLPTARTEPHLLLLKACFPESRSAQFTTYQLAILELACQEYPKMHCLIYSADLKVSGRDRAGVEKDKLEQCLLNVQRHLTTDQS